VQFGSAHASPARTFLHTPKADIDVRARPPSSLFVTSIKPRLDLFPYRANISPVAFATFATGAARSTRTSRASTYAPVRVPTPFPFRVSISHSNDTTAPFRTVFGTVSEIILQNTVVVAFPRASHIASRAWTSTNVSVLPILATRVTVPVALSPVSRASALVDARVARLGAAPPSPSPPPSLSPVAVPSSAVDPRVAPCPDVRLARTGVARASEEPSAAAARVPRAVFRDFPPLAPRMLPSLDAEDRGGGFPSSVIARDARDVDARACDDATARPSIDRSIVARALSGFVF